MKNYTTEEKQMINDVLDSYRKLIFSLPFSSVIDIEPHEQFKRDSGLLNELEVGEWYKCEKSKAIIYYRVDGWDNYGFNNSGEWTKEYCLSSDSTIWTKATHEEVETALIAEAKKRGFKEGVTIKVAHVNEEEKLYEFNPYLNDDNILYSQSKCNINGAERTLFYNGYWATIINTELTELEEQYSKVEAELYTLKEKINNLKKP